MNWQDEYKAWLDTLDEKQKHKVIRAESRVHGLAIIDEAGRTISAASSEKLSAALKSMSDAIAQIGELIGSDGISSNEARITTKALSFDTYYDDGSALVREAGKILAQNDSFDAKRNMVSQALRQRAMAEMAKQKLASMASSDDFYDDYYYSYSCMPHVRDLYDGDVVYSQEKELYQCSYSIGSDGVVTLGDPVSVQVSYVPDTTKTNTEAINLKITGELIELKERAIKDGVAQIKLISPGWGSSGYYSEKMLERDGPNVFKKGLHMYINHPTAQEDLDRPERDVADLAGVLEEDAKYDKNGPTGPGLYAPAKVFSTYSTFIDEAAPYIGTSIRASGRAIEGEAEGRRGYIVDGLVEGYSVDYVTMAGRGGEVLPLLEAARAKLIVTETRRESKDGNTNTTVVIEENNTEVEDTVMNEDQIKALISEAVATATATDKTALVEAQTELARMKEGLILRDARALVESTLRGLDLNDMTRARLLESCSKNPPIKDGVLDVATLIETVKATAIAEMQYITAVAGVAAGGSKPSGVGTTEVSEADVEAMLREAFTGMGMTESSVNVAVSGRS